MYACLAFVEFERCLENDVYLVGTRSAVSSFRFALCSLMIAAVAKVRVKANRLRVTGVSRIPKGV